MADLRTLDNFVAGQLLSQENQVISWFTHPKLDADIRMAAWLDGPQSPGTKDAGAK